MKQNKLSQKPHTKSEYELRRQEKLAERKRAQMKRIFKKASKIGLVVLIVVGGIGALVWYAASQPQTPASEIISRNGIHWHSRLSIYIKGQKQQIPANIGIGVIHTPIHTHDTTGTIHLEFSGLVREDDVRLGKFFKIWDKKFDSSCIFEYCNGPEGMVKMFVNGKPNTEFQNYILKDGDKIEIRYD